MLPSTPRTYHNIPTAQYTLPNDAPEHKRLETQAAHLSALMSHHLIHAPLSPSPSLLLDVGCGTGIVTHHLGTTYPTSHIYGLDLSPVPDVHNRPANVEFIQGDVLELGESGKEGGEGKIIPGSFDLVFSRLLLCGMSDWPRYIATVARLLKPRVGWLECHDLDWVWYDGSEREISRGWEWLRVLREAAEEERGLDFECGGRVEGWMREAGLVDVKRYEYNWPFGGEWESRPEMQAFGEYVAKAMPEMFHHVIPKVTERKGYSEAQIEGWRAQMRRDFRPEKGKHWRFYVTVGRRPE